MKPTKKSKETNSAVCENWYLASWDSLASKYDLGPESANEATEFMYATKTDPAQMPAELLPALQKWFWKELIPHLQSKGFLPEEVTQ